MRNTFIPLSIGFFDSAGRLVDIQDMKPVATADETPEGYSSRFPARFALEVNQGWFAEKGIEIGAFFSFENP